MEKYLATKLDSQIELKQFLAMVSMRMMMAIEIIE